MSDKTEDPTPRRLRRAREEGDSPVSSALMQGIGFLVAVALAPAAVAATLGRAAALIPRAIAEPHAPLSPADVAREVLTLSLPLVAGVALVAVVTGFVQTGGVISWKKLGPDFSKLNPASGLRSLVSKQRLVSIARALVAAVLVGWLALDLVATYAPSVANTAGDIGSAAFAAGVLVKKLGWVAALVGLALGAVDLVITRRAWLERNRMTKDEVKREHKESEGDPELKAARRRAHQEVLASASIAAVRDASVLVVNPTHFATALQYHEDEDETPRVLAQGRGDLARRMREAAHQFGVPVIRDVPVARALSDLEIGDEIPEALYEAVAEILRSAWEETAR